MAYHYPPNVRKYDIIGALFEEPYRVARSQTADIEVPAGAEIVIEGKILAEHAEPEGPLVNSPAMPPTVQQKISS